MEQNNDFSAERSIQLISETLNNSRKAILRNNAKYFLMWGCLLTVLSLLIYFLWHKTGSPSWNFLWFAMWPIGYPIAIAMGKKDTAVPQNEIGRLQGKIWALFGAFAITISAIAIFAVPMNITLLIVVMMGLAESTCGVILKNWPIIIAGFILGVGGAIAATLLKSEAQLLLFTLGGILLAVTGLIVKLQYK